MKIKHSDFEIVGVLDESGEMSWKLIFTPTFAYADDAVSLLKQFLNSE